MRSFNLTYLIFIFSLLFAFSSCKKSSKEIAESLFTESVEKSAKEIVNESSEKSLRSLTKKELRSLEWDDFMKLVRKENINLAEVFSRVDGSLQKKISKAMQTDYDFYSALMSSNTLLDEFYVFVKNAPKAADNIYLLKYFAKGRDMERRFGIYNALGDISIKEETGIIKFIDKTNNSLLGEYRDGVFFLKEPFNAGKSLLNQHSILKKTLIPNSVYKIKGLNGMSYLYHVDDFGRFSKIEASGVDANELMSNVVFVKENLNLGSDWAKKLRTVRQTSKGNDINATVILKYADDGKTPLAVKADITANNKKVVSESFENLDYLAKNSFSAADNASVLNRFAFKTGLSNKKMADLLVEMNQDQELAHLIHSNPDFNIKRWLNTRNHVDKNRLARTANGRTVPNGKVYAGNVYYFNPHLNSALMARLKKTGSINLKKFGSLSYDDLVKLDKLYPNGVPFTREGYPDFSKVAFKDKNGQTLRIDIGFLSGDSKKDINTAETLFQEMGYSWESGYTWHHVENSTTLIRVPSTIHQLVDHAGGMSTHVAEQTIRQAA